MTKLLDRYGNELPPNYFAYDPLGISKLSREWSERIIAEFQKDSYFMRFLPPALYDQFNRRMQRSTKPNKKAGDKIKFGTRILEDND